MSRRRLPIRLSRRSSGGILVALVALGVAALQQWPSTHVEKTASVSSEQYADAGTFRVQRVVDGDTFILTGSTKEHVRLIGANTPETVKQNWPVEPWGPEASAFTKKFLAGGAVRLEFDGPRRDKYGRMLAYVWVGDRMLNEELIRQGLARAEMQYAYSAAMKARFRKAEGEAKAARRGIWSE